MDVNQPPILVIYAREWRSMCGLAGKGEAFAIKQINGLFDGYQSKR